MSEINGEVLKDSKKKKSSKKKEEKGEGEEKKKDKKSKKKKAKVEVVPYPVTHKCEIVEAKLVELT
jgi:hypothetical protein